MLIGASTAIADAGAPTVVTVPIGLLSAWPLGLVVRETVHSVRCWHIRQRRQHAEFLRASAARHAEAEQRQRTYAPAERVVAEPAQLPALQPRPAALPPAHALVIEGEVVETEPRR